MDLYRVIFELQKTNRKVDIGYVNIFLNHALEDFCKFKLNNKDKELKAELENLVDSFKNLNGDLHKRLRLTEKVMMIRCRL